MKIDRFQRDEGLALLAGELVIMHIDPIFRVETELVALELDQRHGRHCGSKLLEHEQRQSNLHRVVGEKVVGLGRQLPPKSFPRRQQGHGQGLRLQRPPLHLADVRLKCGNRRRW